jgi:NAD(P)-dependent dehydrogenase (short-subunit alcohol dehydrogenase family)
LTGQIRRGSVGGRERTGPTDRRPARVDRIEAVVAELGPGTIAIGADVTDRDAMIAVADRMKAELGRAEVLVTAPA